MQVAWLAFWMFSAVVAGFHLSPLRFGCQWHRSFPHYMFLQGHKTYPQFGFTCFHALMPNSNQYYHASCVFCVSLPYFVVLVGLQGTVPFHCNRQETVIKFRFYWPERHPSTFSWENNFLKPNSDKPFPTVRSSWSRALNFAKNEHERIITHIAFLRKSSFLCQEHESKLHSHMYGDGWKKALCQLPH